MWENVVRVKDGAPVLSFRIEEYLCVWICFEEGKGEFSLIYVISIANSIYRCTDMKECFKNGIHRCFNFHFPND